MDNPLIIECNNEGISEEFAREVTSIFGQGNKIYKDPEVKTKDMFKETRLTLIRAAAVFLLALLVSVFAHFDVICIIMIILASIMLLFAVFIMVNFRFTFKKIKELYSIYKRSVLTLDEEGVEVDIDGYKKVRIPWNEVVFLRIFNESLIFFNKDKLRESIICEIKHKDDILNYIGENSVNVRIIQ